MRLLRAIADFRAAGRDVAFAAGFFDGVHLGHRRVIESARARGGEAWALTFARHPSTVLAPGNPRPLLTPLDARLELLAAAGLDGCLLLDFTPRLASMPPREFVESLGPNARSFHSGAAWRFGHNGAGTPGLLRAWNHDVEVVPAVLWRGEPVSSTRVRGAVLAGDLDAAAHMLGRPYSIREAVIPGRAIGRGLGAPTLNFSPVADVLPPHGVYAARVRLPGDAEPRGGVANFGFRPTFPDRPDAPVLEVHLFDPPGRDTQGLAVEIQFAARLRDERAFDSPAALAAQIRRDCDAARQAFRGSFPRLGI